MTKSSGSCVSQSQRDKLASEAFHRTALLQCALAVDLLSMTKTAVRIAAVKRMLLAETTFRNAMPVQKLRNRALTIAHVSQFAT